MVFPVEDFKEKDILCFCGATATSSKFEIIVLEKGACDAASTDAGAYVAINQICAPIVFTSLSNVEMTTFCLQGTR